MLNFTAIIFLILFTTWSVSVKLDQLKSAAKNRNDLMEDRNLQLKLKDTPLRESFRHKHKHKSGTKQHGLRKRFAKIDEIRRTEDPQCAVLYKNNAPVGILQPFEDTYKFLAIKGEPTFVDIQPLFSKIQSADDLFDNSEHFQEKRSNRATFSDENYPSVYTKFQLHNHKDLSKHNTASSREDYKNEDEINSTGDDVGVEEELSSLLDDMGLLDDDVNEDFKRDTEEQIEDENLEIGTNKIDLMKEEKRARRDDELDEDISAALNGTDLNDFTKGNDTTELGNSGIMDLNNNDTKITKKSIEDKSAKLYKRSGSNCEGGSHKVVEYEKRVEREIRDKIKRIKDEVKKEIGKEEDSKREKRQTNTLLDGESEEIDPNFNTEENTIHIRKKRSAARGPFDKNEEKVDKKENNSRRSKREVDASEIDNEEEEEFNENEEVGENDNKIQAINSRDKDDCYCSKDNNYCECSKDAGSSNDEEEDFSKSKKSIKQQCNCDQDGNHCKCSNDDQNFDYYEEDVEDKSIDKKSIKQSCTCDKNNANCKCNNRQFLDNSVYGEYEDSDVDLQKRSVKARKYADDKRFQTGEYFVDLEPDIYRLEPRNKRDDFNALLEANGGDAARKHLLAVKQRSMLPLTRYRRRIYKEESNLKPRKLTNMSQEDLFGALPQSFGGELVRYKRIKRSKKKK